MTDFIRLFTIFLFIGGVAVEGSPEIIPRTDNAEVSQIFRNYARTGEISTQCGGLLETIAGVISYKFLEPLEPSESCVWIVKAANKSNAYFRMVYSGFELTNTSINVYAPITTTGELRYLTTFRQSTSVTQLNGGIFLIQLTTRQSQEKPGTGFILTYDGLGTDTTNLPKFTTRIYPAAIPGLYLHYPTNGENYAQNELSTFVINSEPGKKLFLTVSHVSIPTDNRANQLCTADVLNVYQLNYQQLSSRIRFCAEDAANIVTLESNEPIMITFNAVNRPLVGREGFFLRWDFDDDDGGESTTPELE